MNLIVWGIVGGVNDQNSTVNTCLCRWLGSRKCDKKLLMLRPQVTIRVIWTAQFEDEFPARGRGSGHFRTLILKCLCSPIPRLIQAVNAVHPICIKNQYENNNILGVDTSELRFRSVQNLVLELGTRPRTEPFRIHNQTPNNAGKIWIKHFHGYQIFLLKWCI